MDVNRLHTSVPTRLGYPLCDGHSIVEGVVIRPTRRRQTGEPKTWIKLKSMQFLEERPNELFRQLCQPKDFEMLYLHFCVRPRFNSVVSKDPQLRIRCNSNLEIAQKLFWADVQEAFAKCLSSVGKKAPPGDYDQRVQSVVNKLVAEWLNEEWDAQPPTEILQAPLRLPPVPTAPAEPSVPPQDSNAGAILMPLWRAKGDFAANGYGADYVDLTKGDPVEFVAPPTPLHADHQWSYGRVGDRTGWFPTEFVGQVLYVVLADFLGSEWGSEYLCLAESDVVEIAVAEYPNDSDWTYVRVRIGGREGWAPTQYLRVQH